MSSNVAAHTVLLRPLILGSTSRYRRELLARLHLPFEVEAPHVDETPEAGEQPEALARRLALAKARAVAARHPQAVVIGSDQVADLEGEGRKVSAAQLRYIHERKTSALLCCSVRFGAAFSSLTAQSAS